MLTISPHCGESGDSFGIGSGNGWIVTGGPRSLVDSGPLYAGANVTRISEILHCCASARRPDAVAR
jgi:hypothetical protein